MSRNCRVIAYRLTYMEMLATVPWVMLIPQEAPRTPPCEATTGYHGRPCLVPGRLAHMDLDGSLHYFCAHHLALSRWDYEALGYPDLGTPLRAECDRMVLWRRRWDITRGGRTES